MNNNETLQQKIREIILKYTNEDALKPQYDGMTAWELAGIILREVENASPFRAGEDPDDDVPEKEYQETETNAHVH